MPAEGALIYASDYTDIRKQVSRILGDKILEYPTDTERAKYGYGQNVLSDTQVITREVTDVDDIHIASLRSDVLRIARHCGVDSNPVIQALPSVAAGDIVDNAHLEAFQAAISLLNTNRFEVGEAYSSIEDLIDGNTGNTITHSRTTPWGNTNTYSDNTIKHAFTVDFGTAENARYFFNSGGQLRFSASRSGGVNSFQDQTWTNILNQMGTIVFRHNSCFGNAGENSNIGFYQLTSAPQKVFSKPGTAISVYATQYLANDYTIYMSCNVANNSVGGARYIYVSIEFNDDHTANKSFNDLVTGTLTSTVKLRRATPVITGDVVVTAPTAYNTTYLTS